MEIGRPDVLVVGAGVIGLSTAVHLAESGRLVEVWSAVPPDLTTSAAAGAMWALSLVELQERTLQWSRYTYDRLALLADDPRSGVRLVHGLEASRRETVLPDWAMFPADLRLCSLDELPSGFAAGRCYTVPLVDMPVYLSYLCDRLRAAGGRLVIQRVRSLAELGRRADVVVNCSGARARDLAADEATYPLRGQIVVVANPGITEFFAEESDDDADMLYILPHGKKVVLGGTAEVGSWNMTPDPRIAGRIIARCAEIVPSLAGVPVLDHRVGLRPMRGRVRLEEEPLAGEGRLIHCYGHGGSGVSLSWGCAEAVAARLEARVS